jgi:hypothetical protein
MEKACEQAAKPRFVNSSGIMLSIFFGDADYHNP